MASRLMIQTWKADRKSKKMEYDGLKKELSENKKMDGKKRGEITAKMTTLAKDIDALDRKIERGEED